jgi:hypothetical protein
MWLWMCCKQSLHWVLIVWFRTFMWLNHADTTLVCRFGTSWHSIQGSAFTVYSLCWGAFGLRPWLHLLNDKFPGSSVWLGLNQFLSFGFEICFPRIPFCATFWRKTNFALWLLMWATQASRLPKSGSATILMVPQIDLHDKLNWKPLRFVAWFDLNVLFTQQDTAKESNRLFAYILQLQWLVPHLDFKCKFLLSNTTFNCLFLPNIVWKIANKWDYRWAKFGVIDCQSSPKA